MQDQAFLGPESGLAVPDGAGGVDLHIATQWLHVDRDQVAASLALPPESVRLAMGGFGAVQVAFAHEAQMDKLAAALGIDPVELRIRNALGAGGTLPTGQLV